ncbi:MAG TPA: tetratricopeptide repeat protein [Burkholderiaceae bacterium]
MRPRRALLFCLALAQAASVLAQETNQPAQAAQPDPYLDAMRAISDGRIDQAEDALKRMMEQEPQHAGAWLDLAVIQCELGHTHEAERLFKIIEERYAPPPGIIEVINSQRNGGCRRRVVVHDKLSVLLGRGYDTNVNQGASSPYFALGSGANTQVLDLLPQYLPQHDQYTLLSANYVRDLDARGDTAFLQFQARENDKLTHYDTASLLVGWDSPWRIGTWNTHTTGTAGLLTLGGRQYQRQLQLQERATPPLPLPDHFQFSLLGALSYVEYPTLVNFNAATDELDAQLQYQTQNTAAQFTVGALFDHGNAARLGGDRHGWQAGIMVNSHLDERLNSELGWTWQRWNGESSYSPGLIEQKRKQDTQTFRAGLIMPLRRDLAVELEWRRILNNENISLFEYHGQLLQLSLKWQNF